MVIFGLTVVIMGFVMLVMSVGVVFSGRCLSGSCGAPSAIGHDGESLNCPACPNRRRT